MVKGNIPTSQMVAIFFFTISCCWTLFSHFLFVNRRFSLKFSFAHTLHYISTHGRETSSFTPRMICWNNDILFDHYQKKRRRNSTYIFSHLKIQWNLNKWIDLIFLGWKESYSFNPNETYSNNKITQRNTKWKNERKNMWMEYTSFRSFFRFISW